MSDDAVAYLVIACVTSVAMAGWELFQWFDRRSEKFARDVRCRREQDHDRMWREYQVRQLNDAIRDDSISTWL